MILKFLLSFTTLVLCANAFAEHPSDESLEKWMELQSFDQKFKRLFTDGSHNVIQTLIDYNTIPPEKRSKIESIHKEYLRKVSISQVQKEFMTDNLINQWKEYVKDYAKNYFTQEEMDVLIKFYDTPAGKSVMNKFPEFIDIIDAKIASNIHRDIKYFYNPYKSELGRDVLDIVCDDKNNMETCIIYKKEIAY
ncbi:MAG: DUF2059 domain-containing protein [Neisseria lactamica]|nr:DUF2059 domain-containing protein [Neisseria lactamica]